MENASVFDFWNSYTILSFNQETALFHCFTFSLFSHCKNVKKNVWKNYKVEMMYDAKINCLRKKLLLKSSRIYGQFLLKCKNDWTLANLNLIQNVLKNIRYTNLYDELQLILSVSSTEPLEGSFSKLAEICYEDQNQL